jgi:hypothetical protein
VHVEELPDEYHLDEQASFQAWLQILFESAELLEGSHSGYERIVVDGLYWRFEEIARKNSYPFNVDEDSVRALRNKSAKRYLDWMIDCSKGTTFFTTASGFMGKGLLAIQENDLVVLIAGLDIPMIVREVGDIGNNHRLMGPAYVHGIMYGERWRDYDNGLS